MGLGKISNQIERKDGSKRAKEGTNKKLKGKPKKTGNKTQSC